MTLMIDLRHIRNIIFNAQSNMTHPATWPNTAPTTKMIVQNLTEIWWKRLKCHLHYSPNSAPATKSASWISLNFAKKWQLNYLTLLLLDSAIDVGPRLLRSVKSRKPPDADYLSCHLEASSSSPITRDLSLPNGTDPSWHPCFVGEVTVNFPNFLHPKVHGNPLVMLSPRPEILDFNPLVPLDQGWATAPSIYRKHLNCLRCS